METKILDFEQFLMKYEDDIHIEYMETGAYYELDNPLELFEERKYLEYLNEAEKTNEMESS